MGKREPKPKVLDGERYRALRTGGPDFESALVVFTLLGTFTEDGETIIPPPSLQFMHNLLGLAWREDTAIALREILDQAHRDPGPDGFARALLSLQQVWEDVFVDPPLDGGGRPPKYNEAGDFTATAAFEWALADAKQRNPDVLVGTVMERLVQKLAMRRLTKDEQRLIVRRLKDARTRTRRTFYNSRVTRCRQSQGLPPGQALNRRDAAKAKQDGERDYYEWINAFIYPKRAWKDEKPRSKKAM